MIKSRRLAIVIVAATGVVACTADKFHRSAYPSGWSQAVTLATQARCGMDRWGKGVMVQSNLDLLVSRGELTAEQAHRAVEQDVRPGDPECLAWAAFGLQQAKITTQTDGHGRLFALSIDYACDMADVACPGRHVTVVDGKVSAVRTLTPADR